MKVIVFVCENDLTDPRVFATVEAYSTWYLDSYGLDEDLRLACEKLNKGEGYADASSWVGWVEVKS